MPDADTEGKCACGVIMWRGDRSAGCGLEITTQNTATGTNGVCGVANPQMKQRELG